jgi:outer membrane protein OmpA-like peptidoglycan-associated protein
VQVSQAQKKDKKDKKKWMFTDFKPNDSTSIFRASKLQFTNINKVRYYYNQKKRSRIKQLSDEKLYNQLLIALTDYVGKFGILNFNKDMDMLWHLARVAEHEEKWDTAKEAWRMIIKHHRGDSWLSLKYHNPNEDKNWAEIRSESLQAAIHHYDSLTEFEKDLYVDLEVYYNLVELRKTIDTLHPPKSVLLNMGEAINSPHEDYGMTISGLSDNKILFTSSRLMGPFKGVVADLHNRVNEDIFYSDRDEDGIWGEAAPLEAINTSYKEGSPCMDKSGNLIIFSRCFSPDSYGNCDLYYTQRVNDTAWTEAVNLGENINGSAWDSHPSLSITGDTLYFSSDREGGFGGADIYMSIKNKKKGYWEKAQNIGPVINTQNNEVSPHIHPKFNVLYFSSDGQMINYGHFDIFKSYYVNGSWVESKNIGPLVNGIGSEMYFAIDSKSEYLFYAKSSNEGKNNLDLFSFPLPMEAQPEAIVRFSGRVIEPTTGEVFGGIVTVIDLDHGVEITPKNLRDDGSFEFDLIDKRRYLLLVEGDNFFRIEEMFTMDGDMSDTLSPAPIVPVKEEGFMGAERKSVTFESIDFDPSSAKLKPEMENNLHLVIDFLVTHPKFDLEVIGHTDSDGDPIANMRLSHDRAENIRKYIVAYGSLDHGRVKAIGLGDTDPIIKNPVKPEEKKLNRRVEFRLFETKK